MHLPDVLPLFHREIMIHALHHHAAKILNASQKMAKPDAHVFHHTLAMHMELVADPNAFIIQIVPVEWLAYVNIAEIHVRVSVVRTQNVMLLIMCQFVHAFGITRAIHSLDADQHRKYVSIFFI